MYCFYFIENIENFEKYKDRLILLLNKSSDDNFILGFNNILENLDQKTQYLDSLKINILNKTLKILICIDRNDNEKIISTCQIKISLQDTTQHIANLQKGIIDPKYRGSLLLKQTLHEISSYCLCNNIELLTLDVRENSPAHKIWLKFGFKVFGVLKDYSRVNNQKYNGIYMVQSSLDLFTSTKPKSTT